MCKHIETSSSWESRWAWSASPAQVFVVLDGWGGIRFPMKHGLLEKRFVAVVPPREEHTIFGSHLEERKEKSMEMKETMR